MKLLVWIGALLASVSLLFLLNAPRVERLERVTSAGDFSLQRDASTVSGYERGHRGLIVPEHLTESLEWISATQLQASRGALRQRDLPWENAPAGRALHAPAPYRAWLLSVACIHHLVTGMPFAASVERAALYADPLLHLLLLAALSALLFRWHGLWAGALSALGLSLLFPLEAAWLPGVPESFSLGLALAALSLVFLLRGLENAQTRRLLLVSGALAGLGLWTHPATFVPLIASVVLAGGVVRRKEGDDDPLPLWRAWALAGSLVALLGWLFESFPDRFLERELRVLHPVYLVSWLGLVETVFRVQLLLLRRKVSKKEGVALLAAVLALASLPAAMYFGHSAGFLSVDLLSFRLSKSTEGIMQPNLATWFTSEKLSPELFAVVAPVLLLPLGFILARKPSGKVLLILSITLALHLVLAAIQLRVSQVVGIISLLLLSLTAARLATESLGLKVFAGLTGFSVLLPSLVLLPGQLRPKNTANVSLAEAESLVERDFAQWLSRHSPAGANTIVLAPPRFSTSLSYYGGLRTIPSLDWENKEGLAFALRVSISTSREETNVLLKNRSVTHIVLPSWDPFLENYTRSATVQAGELFFDSLKRWVVPLWLKPVAYQLPAIPGFEGQMLTVFEVVDEQDEGLFASRTAEYFIEMQNLETAKSLLPVLKKYPADLSAQIGRAQIEVVSGTQSSFNTQVDALAKRLGTPSERGLPWDRRVSLCALLARAQRLEPLKAQMEKCLAEADEVRIKSLSTYSLFHFMAISKRLGLPFPKPGLRELALDLLPAELQAKL